LGKTEKKRSGKKRGGIKAKVEAGEVRRKHSFGAKLVRKKHRGLWL